MQMAANRIEQPLASGQLARLELGDQTVECEIPPPMAKAKGSRYPTQDLKIAQAARAFFAIRLQAVGRILVAAMSLLKFKKLALREFLDVDGLEPALK